VIRCLRLILALALLTVSAAAAPNQAPNHAPVLAAVPGALAWQNAPLNWQIDHGQTLSITALGKTDWFVSPMDGARRDNSPRLVFQAADDFVLSAKVTVDFRSMWDAGVLVLYVNDATWAKLCLEMTVEKHPAIVSVVTRGTSDDNNSIAIRGNSVYLKIAKAGQAIFFYASEDGQNWKTIRAFSLGKVDNLRVGFSSQSPTGERCTTVFDHIDYQARRVDLWTGK
jgi:regulation of enolase protein 1 (concanavalin A-like superfamily)